MNCAVISAPKSTSPIPAAARTNHHRRSEPNGTRSTKDLMVFAAVQTYQSVISATHKVPSLMARRRVRSAPSLARAGEESRPACAVSLVVNF